MNILIISSWILLFLRMETQRSRICLFLLFLVYHLIFRRKEWKQMILGSLIMILTLNQSDISTLNANEGIVIETRMNYAIAQMENEKVLIYTKDPLFPKSTIKRTGICRLIQSLSNFHSSDFEKFLINQGIYWSCQPDEIEVIQEVESLQSRLYDQILKFKNEKTRDWLLAVFMQDHDHNINHLLTSAGMHVSSLNRLIRNRFLYGEWIASLLCLFMGKSFGFSIVYLRCIISNLLLLLKGKISSKDRLGLEMLILMLLKPGCVYEIGFLLPIGIKFIQQFNLSKSNLPVKVFLYWFQCQYFYQADLISLFLFPLLQTVNTALFLIGLVVCIVPVLEFLLVPFYVFERLPIIYFGACFTPLSLCLVLVLILSHMKHKTVKKAFMIVGICLFVHFQAVFDPFYEVTFLNVGQGDSILIELPFHRATILVDVPAYQADTVFSELTAKGIHHIDTLILTHQDQDHAGGKDELLKLIEVENIVEEKMSLDYEIFTMECLNQKKYNDDNNDSLVYTFEINGLKYMLMADATKLVEEDLISNYELDCDILKIGHHGSKTSTSSLFIQNVTPKLAIISCLKNNIYNHPHPQTIETLNKYQIRTLLTSEDGAVSIKSFLNFHFISTSTHRYSLIIS